MGIEEIRVIKVLLSGILGQLIVISILLAKIVNYVSAVR